MRRRLISLMAALAIGTVGALAFAAPGNAATTPARIFTLFILDTDKLDDDTKGLG